MQCDRRLVKPSKDLALENAWLEYLEVKPWL
jgi:hypothetical protein